MEKGNSWVAGQSTFVMAGMFFGRFREDVIDFIACAIANVEVMMRAKQIVGGLVGDDIDGEPVRRGFGYEIVVTASLVGGGVTVVAGVVVTEFVGGDKS